MKLLAFAIAFVSGTVVASHIGDYVYVHLIALALFAAAALLGALLLASMRQSLLPALIALAFILGIARVAAIGDTPPPMYASPRLQQVEGVVVSDVESPGGFARFRLGLERIKPGGGEWKPAEGTLLVTARATAEIARIREMRRTSDTATA